MDVRNFRRKKGLWIKYLGHPNIVRREKKPSRAVVVVISHKHWQQRSKRRRNGAASISSAEEHTVRRRIGGGGERVDSSLGFHTLRRHQRRQDAARSSHPEAPIFRLRHLLGEGGRRRRHGQHGRRRALRPRPHRQLRPPRENQGR